MSGSRHSMPAKQSPTGNMAYSVLEAVDAFIIPYQVARCRKLSRACAMKISSLHVRYRDSAGSMCSIRPYRLASPGWRQLISALPVTPLKHGRHVYFRCRLLSKYGIADRSHHEVAIECHGDARADEMPQAFVIIATNERVISLNGKRR